MVGLNNNMCIASSNITCTVICREIKCKRIMKSKHFLVYDFKKRICNKYNLT